MTLIRNKGSVSPPKIQDTSKANKIELNSASNHIELTTNSTLQGIINDSGDLIFGTASGASGIEIVRSSAATDFGLKITNNSSGDAKVTLETAVTAYSLGVDNSDSDNFKISTSSTDLGTSTIFTMTPAGNLTLTGSLNLGSNLISGVTDPVSAQDAATMNYVDNAVAGSNELSELTDVTLASLATGQLLYSNDGTDWANTSSIYSNAAGTKLSIGTNDFSGFGLLKLYNGGVTFQDTTTGLATGDGVQLSLDGANNFNFLSREAGDFNFSTSSISRVCIDDSEGGQLRVQDSGSAASPSFAINTSNLGMYSPGADSLAFTTGGVERVRVTNSAVEMGSLTNNLLTTGTVDGADSKSLALCGGGVASSARGGYIQTYGNEHLGSPGVTALISGNVAGGAINLSAIHSAGYISFATSTLERARFDSSGNLSMVTGQILSVDGTVSLPGISFVTDPDTGLSLSGTNSLRLSTGGTLGLTIDASQSVGIGIETPTAKLDVSSPNYPVIRTTRTSTQSAASRGGLSLLHKTSVDMADDFGVGLSFEVEDDTSGSKVIGFINAYRDGADNIGSMSFLVGDDATEEALLLNPDRQALFFAGTAALPSHSFITDPDSGMYLIGDANIGFSLAGTSRLDLNASRANFDIAAQFIDGSAAFPSIRFGGDQDTGLYSDAVNALGIAAGGVSKLIISSGSVRSLVTVLLPGGSDGSPTLSFTTDPDTGIFNAGANELGISTGGVERLRIDSAGNVGIGMTPTGNSALVIAGSDDLQPIIKTKGITGNGFTLLGDAYTATLSQINIGVSHSGSGAVFSNNVKVSSAADNTYLSSQGLYSSQPTAMRMGQGTIKFLSASASALTAVDTAVSMIERVVINTEGQMLTSNGTAALPSRSFINDPDTGIYTIGANNLQIAVGGVNKVNINSGIVDFKNAVQTIAGTAALPSYRFSSDADTGLFSPLVGTLGFATGGVERLRVTSSGIGMGTTASHGRLTIAGGTFSTPAIGIGNFIATSASGLVIGGQGTTSDVVIVDRSGTNALTVLAGAQAAFSNGTAAAPSITFLSDVDTGIFRPTADNLAMSTGGVQGFLMNGSGTIQFSTYGAGTLSTDASGNISASDGRLKTKLSREVQGKDTILALKPTWYDWNDDSGYNTEHSELGFIAQEVGSIESEFSPGTDETVPVRNYHDRAIIASLVKHNQELEERLAKLETLLSDDGK